MESAYSGSGFSKADMLLLKDIAAAAGGENTMKALGLVHFGLIDWKTDPTASEAITSAASRPIKSAPLEPVRSASVHPLTSAPFEPNYAINKYEGHLGGN